MKINQATPIRIYTVRRTAAIAFLGGPIAAGWAISRNWKAIGDDKKAEQALLVGVITTLVILAFLYLLPQETVDKIPSALLPAIYTGISVTYVQQNQKAALEKILAKGGKKFSIWNCIKVAIGAVMVMFVLALPFILLG